MLLIANIFQPLIDVFEAVLKFFHNSVGVPWGWSIVLLTVVVRAVLTPLTVKQFHSMQKLQKLQPELKAIQNKYKEDKQRQQQEIMKFYKENEVNPLGSCLPLVAQLPVFISLFYMLRTSLRKDICPQIQHVFQAAHHTTATTPCGPHGGAGFLFVPDLTDKATGAVLVVLIVLYVGTQLASSLMMSSPTMDKTQRQIMLVMPLFFVIFIINFPAGVIVYWVTTNLWTMGQQYIIRRRLGPITAPVAAGAGAAALTDGGGARGKPEPTATASGSGSGSESNGADAPAAGGLGALLRGRTKEPKEPKEQATVGTKPRTRSAPPPPPRKKKKRSGRRR